MKYIKIFKHRKTNKSHSSKFKVLKIMMGLKNENIKKQIMYGQQKTSVKFAHMFHTEYPWECRVAW